MNPFQLIGPYTIHSCFLDGRHIWTHVWRHSWRHSDERQTVDRDRNVAIRYEERASKITNPARLPQ